MLGFSILIGHLLGDYVFQNDFLAATKSKSSLACAIHVVVYTFAMFCAIELHNLATGYSAWPWWAYFAIASTHFFIDRFRLAVPLMERLGQTHFKENLGPWSVIIIDNTLHLGVAWLSGLVAIAVGATQL